MSNKNCVDALRTVAEFPITDPSNMDAMNMRKIAVDALESCESQSMDKISTDALTKADRLLLARVNDCTKPIDAADRNGILNLIDRLAACPSSQPAAAPKFNKQKMLASAREHGMDLGDNPVAYEFYNKATGHAVVDYTRWTHRGHLTEKDGYEARPLAYANAEMAQPAAAPCKRCGAATAQACNDKGCFYLESGDGEPTVPAPADEQSEAASVDTLIARPDPLNREPSEYASDMLKRAAADSIRRENAPAPADEQPAAAPIDTPTDREFALSAALCVHPKGVYGDEGGSMCCPITHTRDASFAPSPADERKIVAQLLFALTERQKGNVIRSEDEYIDSARALLAAHPGQPEPADCGETLPGEYTNADDLIASLREPEPRECRHCGWMCITNSTPSKTWYPLPQPEPRAEVTDEQIADMFERVTGYSIENGRAALNEADILGFARELLEAARAGDAS